MNDYNQKMRELYCITCKQYSESREPAPICEVCQRPLVTVVYSLIDGSRITGNNAEKLA